MVKVDLIFGCVECLILLFYGFFIQVNIAKVDFKDGDVKLVDGTTKQEGTVLVFRGYAWGTICDDDWSLINGHVICRQLGMSHALKIFKNNRFNSRGLPHFLLDNVNCNGEEKRISDCRHNGWARHDCQRRELAGVQCANIQVVKERRPEWNPLEISAPKEQLLKLRKGKFTYKLQAVESLNNTYLLVASVGGVEGLFCSDYFLAIEANVVCKKNFKGLLGKNVISISKEKIAKNQHAILVTVGRCFGNESDLHECVSYATSDGSVPCKQKSIAVAIECTEVLPDLVTDAGELERSSYMNRMPLWHLECALSENCLPEEVYGIIDRNPHSYAWISRSLMRFSSIIENIGDADFLPKEHSDNWEWHACHFHYHSMKVFARYEIIDNDKQVVASGHKASFCLEDNYCKRGVSQKFRCSNVADNKGTQGISPGCKDTYLHDYDCQWVDITNVRPGVYTFQMIINPEFLVAESNFFNNAVVCKMHYIGMNAVLRDCILKHAHETL